MSSNHPTPNFQNLSRYQSLSTKKERKKNFSTFGPPPKAPIRSCPVRRIYTIFKEDAPRPVSFREDSDCTFISDSPLYSTNKGTYFEQCYTVEKLLGRGSFGEVFKVISKENGLSYACKRMLLKYRGQLDRFHKIQEVKKHEQLPPHVNCVRFYRAWEEANHLYLLTEVCQYSLAEILFNNHEFSENELWSFLVDILQGLHHLHDHKLMHMDVKPENIFIGMDRHCKLGDFGLVIDFTNGYPAEAVEGDPKYLAPECLQNIYTPAADIFSLGMVMLEVATDYFLPHSGPQWHELRIGNIPSLEYKGLSSEFEAIVRGFLEPNPYCRLTSAEALNFKSVKRVSRKKKFNNFFMSKAMAIKYCIQSLLVWPLVFISLVSSVINRRFLQSAKTNECGFDKIDSLNVSMKDRKVTNDSVGSLCLSGCEETSSFSLMKPIINSTPISSMKRRQIHPRHNLSRCHSDEDSVDGNKFNFNESSFSSLDASHEDFVNQSTTQEERGLYSIDVTARNLLEVFNTVDSSDDDY